MSCTIGFSEIEKTSFHPRLFFTCGKGDALLRWLLRPVPVLGEIPANSGSKGSVSICHVRLRSCSKCPPENTTRRHARYGHSELCRQDLLALRCGNTCTILAGWWLAASPHPVMDSPFFTGPAISADRPLSLSAFWET